MAVSLNLRMILNYYSCKTVSKTPFIFLYSLDNCCSFCSASFGSNNGDAATTTLKTRRKIEYLRSLEINSDLSYQILTLVQMKVNLA